MSGREALPQSGTPVDVLRSYVRMTRQICSCLELNERIRGKQLVKGCEGFKCRGTASETAVPVARRQDHTAKQAQDRSAAEARPHFPFDSHGGVPDAAVPGLVLVLELHRDIHFDLVMHTEPL